MNTEKLAEYFISHCSRFAEDLELAEIDNKHVGIVSEAYNKIKNGEAFKIANFRNWEAQSDIPTPAQFSLESMKGIGLKARLGYLKRFAIAKIFNRRDDACKLSSLLDDIELIRMLGAEDLIRENPVHLTPGATYYYTIMGTSINLRWLRYLYILGRVQDAGLLEDNEVWVDVGSYYGGLQGLVRKYRPDSKIVLVDFHHQLCRSYIYLSLLYPNGVHILPDQVASYKKLEEMPAGSFMYLPVSDFEKIADQKADLVTNYFSLGEMRREFFNIYMDSQLFRKSKNMYLINRVVSSPYYEKTYDTDVTILDYISRDREVRYFDIFPMHHYLQIYRMVLGRKAFRNISSPYFELISSDV